MVLAAFVLTSTFVALLVWAALRVTGDRRRSVFPGQSFEGERRDYLRSISQTYRWLEPLIDEFQSVPGQLQPKMIEQLGKALKTAGVPFNWTPEEFYLVKHFEGLAIGGVMAGIVGLMTGNAMFIGVAFVGVAWFYGQNTIGDFLKKVEKTQSQIRRQLPFAVDLMALTMEAGATFSDSMNSAATELGKHPLGRELARVISQLELGVPRKEALMSMGERLQSQDIKDVVASVIKGEELGVPLAKILREQAEEMRLRRSQWGEKAAGEAQVKIMFPGGIVMVACLIIVLAHFIIPALSIALF